MPEGSGGEEVGALTGVTTGNQQVAGIGSQFPHTISPIDFYMYPVLDLTDQNYTAINFPVTLATGRDVRIRIVILSGPPAVEGTTRERRPGDPSRTARPPERAGSERARWFRRRRPVLRGGS